MSRCGKGLEAYASFFNLIGLLGPIAAALFLVLTSGSDALKIDFKDGLFNLRRIRPIYVIFAMCLVASDRALFGASSRNFLAVDT